MDAHLERGPRSLHSVQRRAADRPFHPWLTTVQARRITEGGSGRAPSWAARAASRPSGRLTTAARRSRSIRSRTASAVSERPSLEVGAEHGPGRADPGLGEQRTQERRRQVDDRGGLAGERQRGGDGVERLRVGGERQLAEAAARGDGGIRQVRGQPLLEGAGARGGDERGARRAARIQIDQQRRPVGLGGGAGERRGGGPRPLRTSRSRHQDDGTRFRCAFTTCEVGKAHRTRHRGLACAEEVTASVSARAGIGEGGRRRTVTRPPSTETPRRPPQPSPARRRALPRRPAGRKRAPAPRPPRRRRQASASSPATRSCSASRPASSNAGSAATSSTVLWPLSARPPSTPHPTTAVEV